MDLKSFGLRNTSLFDSQGLVSGVWKPAPSGKVFDVIEPSTKKTLASCADFDREAFLEAIDAAYDGYQEYSSNTTAKERGAILRRWYELIIENLEDCKMANLLLTAGPYDSELIFFDSGHHIIFRKWENPE
jgi:acyl-CoA reductase-like NAD-dependent aldehyde dehydrogenase